MTRLARLTRTALAAFAAVGMIAATGVVGVASAAAADTVRSPSLELSAHIARLSTPGDPRLPVVKDYTIAEVESKGHNTNTSNQACQNYANVINGLIGEALQALYTDNMAGAKGKLEQAVSVLNEAEEVGCAIE